MYTSQQLWNLDIEIEKETKKFFLKVPMYDHFKLIPRQTKGWSLPIFLYCELREKQNYLSTFTIHGGSSSRGAISAVSGGRELINEMDLSNYTDEKCRGIVLEAFCKIEFCLDVSVCVEMGAYEGKLPLADIRDDLREESGLFSSSSKKLKYLKQRGFIDNNTYILLNKAKKIRNIMAHQYLISDEIMPLLGIDNIKSWQKDLTLIYNNAWHYLLSNFAMKQRPILTWVLSSSKGQT